MRSLYGSENVECVNKLTGASPDTFNMLSGCAYNLLIISLVMVILFCFQKKTSLVLLTANVINLGRWTDPSIPITALRHY